VLGPLAVIMLLYLARSTPRVPQTSARRTRAAA